MLLFNAVVLSVIVMLVLSVARVHVVISLFVASLVGGLVAGMGISGTMVAFQDGLAGGAKIALSYALLGAFAMSVAHSGLPRLLANWIITTVFALCQGLMGKNLAFLVSKGCSVVGPFFALYFLRKGLYACVKRRRSK